MRTNYFLKRVLFAFVVLFASTSLFAQPKVATFTELTNMVTGESGSTNLELFYETGLAWGDFNNDGYLDLLIAGETHNGSQTILYMNNGGVNFTKIETPFPGLRAAAAAWLDYDNDGNLDLIIAGTDALGKYTGLWRNMGSENNYEFEEVMIGSFYQMDHEGGNKSNKYIAVGDYDNDGWIDIYMQGWASDSPTGRTAVLYKNNFGLSFDRIDYPVKGTQPLIQWNAGSAQFGDYNNDGFLDLICFGYGIGTDDYIEHYGQDFGYEQNGGVYYKNNGDGTFDIGGYFEGGDKGDVTWLDFNNDGKLDFAVTGYAWYNGGGWQGDVFLNNGDDTFTRFNSGETGMPAQEEAALTVGDVNNDGYEDILYMKADQSDAIFLNNYGDHTFNRADFSYNFASRGGSASLVDFDRDNDLDALIAAYADVENHFARLMRNDLGEGIPVNQAPSVPSGLKVSAMDENGYITFSWNPSTDDITPQQALRYNIYVQQEGSDQTAFVLAADAETGLLKVNDYVAPLYTTFYKMKDLEVEANYTLGVQAIDNAKVSSKFATIEFTAGTATNINSVKFENIVINGTKGAIVINSTDAAANGNVTVYNVNGASVFAATQINNTISLPAGVYIVKINTDNNTKVEKVIVK